MLQRGMLAEGFGGWCVSVTSLHKRGQGLQRPGSQWLFVASGRLFQDAELQLACGKTASRSRQGVVRCWKTLNTPREH